MRTVRAFVVRDFWIAWSYRLNFVYQSVSIFFSVLSIRFTANLFGDHMPAALTRYGATTSPLFCSVCRSASSGIPP
jgi:hypothetical protein